MSNRDDFRQQDGRSFQGSETQRGPIGLIEMGIFASMLLLGFVYVWKKGALEWE